MEVSRNVERIQELWMPNANVAQFFYPMGMKLEIMSKSLMALGGEREAMEKWKCKQVSQT